MSVLSEEAAPAVALLLASDESQLYEELGIRAAAIERQPEIAGSFAPPVTYDAAAMGPLDSVRDVGRRIFRLWEASAYGLACGTDASDKEDRQSLTDAFGGKSTTVAALMAALLVSHFGMAPAIAAVIAAIVVRRFFPAGVRGILRRLG